MIIAPSSRTREAGSIAKRVRALSAAGWAVRARNPRPDLIAASPPFAFAFFTDDRRHSDIVSILEQFPAARDSGPVAVVFRHDSLQAIPRLALAQTCRDITHENGHFFIMARSSLARADGQHGQGPRPSANPSYWQSAPVHSLSEGLAAAGRGAKLSYVSPVFPTRSHLGAPTLGGPRAGRIANALPIACFALGGITARNSRRLHGLPICGIAGIGSISD